MGVELVPAGKKLPEDIFVVVEIPQNSDPIKYEVDHDSGCIFVDRFMATPMFYPCNYGFINQTLSLDGDPLDVLVPTPYPLIPGSVIRCRPVGILQMEDESGVDAKIVAMPHSEAGKWVKVKGWSDKAAAEKEILESAKRYQESLNK